MNKRKNQNTNENEHLQQQFQHAVSEGRDWLSIWALLVEHPAFDRIIGATIFRILKSYNMPLEWSDDIRQESLILFSRIIQRKNDLGFDSSRSRLTTWLGTLINGCCLKAIRQFKDSLRQRLNVLPGDALYDSVHQLDQQIDFQDQLNRLDDKYRIPLFQFWQGVSIEELAKQDRTSHRTVYRRIEKGIELLRKKLAA